MNIDFISYLNHINFFNEHILFFSIFIGTFISEDIALLMAATLIFTKKIPIFYGFNAVFWGILIGDLGIWFIGFFLKKNIFNTNKRKSLLKHLNNNSNIIRNIILTRFLPGTRVIYYLYLGFLTAKYNDYSILLKFLYGSFIAIFLWVSFILILTYFLGESLMKYFIQQYNIYTITVLFIILIILFYILKILLNPDKRKIFLIHVEKLFRYEFLPAYIFYIPLAFYILYLSLKYRKFTIITQANPGIFLSGIVGESKFEILKQLPNKYVLKFYFIPEDDIEKQFNMILSYAKKLKYPFVLKPNESQRGASVKIIYNQNEILPYLQETRCNLLMQQYHKGPYEIGIFYYRYPDQENGKIFSITGKEFPYVIGDGHSTLKELILNHPRYKFQYKVYFKRWENILDHLLPEKEIFYLTKIGNHCQGTKFIDRKDLITKKLEKTIDSIAKYFNGFYFGRFDIRYENEEDLKNGKNFYIVELNGATAESTNIYDPAFNILKAYKILFEQWKILFEIGYKNAKNKNLISLKELLKIIYNYYKLRNFSLIAKS
ncbi:MAG: hypothetical protein KatS3mg129_2847 [Leptospiraceae bacterium]|nr:MAG: hypothetical protein KatS3mg129_2847 [Leptospiraceae bacterium]